MIATSRPTTAAARDRGIRILDIAETMFVQEGEHRLQMKGLAGRASVSLATLYQLFPSKDHVLAAIALARQERMRANLAGFTFPGDSPGERAAHVMLEEFKAVQRHPEIAAALQRVTTAPNRSTSEYVQGVRDAIEDTVLSAMDSGSGSPTPEQAALLPAFLAVASAAMNGWLSGLLSVDQVGTQIRMAQRLLDVPPDVARYLVGVEN